MHHNDHATPKEKLTQLNVTTLEGKLSLAEQIKNGKDILSELESLNNLAAKLTQLLSDLNRLITEESSLQVTSEQFFENVCSLEAIYALKSELRGSKIHWQETVESSYSPLSQSWHAFSYISNGQLLSTEKMQELEHFHQLPHALSGNEIMGIIFEENSQSHIRQEKAFNSFLCLNELLYCDSLSIFPVPISSSRGKTDRSLTMTFEIPQCRPLGRLLGYSLAKCLRSKPGILSLWLSQLAIAMAALAQCSGSLVKRNINIMEDVFVRADGRLLLGNLAFHCSRRIDEEKAFPLGFLRMISHLVATVLCVSRKESIELSSPSPNPTASGDRVYYVEEGCSISLSVGNCSVHKVDYCDVEALDSPDDFRSGSGILTVRIEGNQRGSIAVDDDVDSLQSNESPFHAHPDLQDRTDGRSAQLNIHALKSAVVRLQLSTIAHFRDDIEVRAPSRSLSEYALRNTEGGQHNQPTKTFPRTKSASMTVIVLPKILPVNSVELQELVVLLGEYHRTGDASALLRAQLFRPHDGKNWNREICRRGFGVLLQQLAADWKSTLNEIDSSQSQYFNH